MHHACRLKFENIFNGNGTTLHFTTTTASMYMTFSIQAGCKINKNLSFISNPKRTSTRDHKKKIFLSSNARHSWSCFIMKREHRNNINGFEKCVILLYRRTFFYYTVLMNGIISNVA